MHVLGERFKDFPHEIKGNNDLLSLTRPDVIYKIHLVRFSYSINLNIKTLFWGTKEA